MKRAFNIADELRRAFGAIADQKLEEWDEANPEPKTIPDLIQYAQEIESGQAVVNIELLKEADWNFSRKLFCEIVRTPCCEAATRLHDDWKKARKTFQRKIHTARDQYLQRVLFDGADHTSLIEDYRNFTPTR